MQVNTAAFHATRHMSSSQLHPPHSVCLFCGSDQCSQGFLLQNNPEVRLLKCPHCGAASASRLPTTEALNEYYKHYYKSESLKYYNTKTTFEDEGRLGRHLSRRILKHFDRSSIHILDFGGGDGTIALETAKELVKAGLGAVDIDVIDLNIAQTASCDSRISLNHYESLDRLSSGRYDFIIASAVIEHIPQAKNTLCSLLTLLDDGGIFYARTPYVIPFVSLFDHFGLKWDFTFPAHIHDLGQEFWESFFTNGLYSDQFQVLASQPSIIETTLRKHFFRTASAAVFKAPWHLLGSRYKLVGGWEIFVRKYTEKT